MMKKALSVFLAVILMFHFQIPAQAESEIPVVIDGVQIQFDQAPVMVNGRVLVPLRKIFEILGAFVRWDSETQTIDVLTNKNKVFILKLGDNKAYTGNGVIALDSPAIELNGRTLVPLRFVSEQCGASVEWLPYWGDSDYFVKITTEQQQEIEIPYYNEFKTVPDFGRAFGVEKLVSMVTDDGYLYSYSNDFPASYIDGYVSLLQECGFNFHKSLKDAKENLIVVYSNDVVSVAIGYAYDRFVVTLHSRL